MREDACPTIAMQSFGVQHGDLHGANMMLKTPEQKEALKKLGAKGINGGAIPIDLAEYLELSASSMKSIAQLSMACIKTGTQTDMGKRIQTRHQAMKYLDALLGDKASKISVQDKNSVLMKIEASPLRILEKLYEEDKIAALLNFTGSHGVNTQSVRRASRKFDPFITNVADYSKTLSPKSPELEQFNKSREAASQLALTQMEKNAGISLSSADRKQYSQYISSRLFNTNGSDPEQIKAAIDGKTNTIGRLQNEIDILKDILRIFGVA
jgi:hypothetical protein